MSNILTPGLMPNSLTGIQTAFDAGTAGEKSTFQAAVSGAWNFSLPPSLHQVEKAMASAPTVTSGTAATLARFWPASPSRNAGALVAGGSFFSLSRAGNFMPYYATGIYSQYISSVSGSSPDRGGNMCVSFMLDDSDFELVLWGGNGGSGIGLSPKFRVKVNDEYVSLTPTVLTTDNSKYYYKYNFGSVEQRRIDIIVDSSVFGGIYTNASGSVSPAQVRGPRVICVGDSFTGGAVGNYGTLDNWCNALADAFGWDDVWSSGVGGTGFANGTNLNLINRLTNDVIAWSPDIVVIGMGRNDNTTAPATVGAAAAAVYAALKSDPRTAKSLIVQYGPMWGSGPSGYSSGLVAVRDAIKAQALAAGVLFIDPLMRPLADRTLRLGAANPVAGSIGQITQLPATATISGAISVGASSFNVSAGTLPWPCTVRIDSEYVYVKSNSYNSSTYQIDGTFKVAHSSGALATQVGDGVVVGSGRVGATTGFGNADRYLASDGVHPTTALQVALGLDCATRMHGAIRAGKTSGLA